MPFLASFSTDAQHSLMKLAVIALLVSSAAAWQLPGFGAKRPAHTVASVAASPVPVVVEAPTAGVLLGRRAVLYSGLSAGLVTLSEPAYAAGKANKGGSGFAKAPKKMAAKPKPAAKKPVAKKAASKPKAKVAAKPAVKKVAAKPAPKKAAPKKVVAKAAPKKAAAAKPAKAIAKTKPAKATRGQAPTTSREERLAYAQGKKK